MVAHSCLQNFLKEDKPPTMRASGILSRGAKGYSWYNHFLKHGNEGFKRNTPPTPFDWSQNATGRSKVFFDIAIGTEDAGRIVFELADDIVPETVKNFKLLVTGDNMHKRSYLQTKFHQVQKGQFIMGGDVENGDGTGSYSAFKDRYIKDENFIIPHTERGFLRYVSIANSVILQKKTKHNEAFCMFTAWLRWAWIRVVLSSMYL